MIANKWYCIAQTSTFDTRCSINVAFDGHDIQFSASVKYGASSINITRCIIPDGISFSIRLRESGSQWFVDITSSAKITPVVTVADSEYWSSVNKPAAEGNIILLLTDITSKYNTSSFGGDSLFELVNVGTSDVPRYAVVPKVFQGQNPGVISRTFMTFGGLGADSNGEDDPSGVSYLRNLLDVRLSESLEDSDVLTYDKNQDLWVNKKGGFNEEKLEEYLEKYKYITEDDIKGLLVLLQWFEFDDANHAVRVKSDFNFVVPNALSFGGLGSYSGGGEGGVSYLKNLLDVQLGTLLEDGEVLVYDRHLDRWVNKSIETGLDVDSLQKYLTDNKYITSAAVDGLQGQINNNATNIALLLSWLEYDEVNKALRVKNGYNFIVDGALSFGGLGEDDNPTPGGLTQVTIQLGNNPKDSYVSENGKVILPAYPVIPTLLSAFENDKGYLVVSDLHGYAKLTDIPSVEGFALAEDLNALSKQIEGYDNKFADVGESILDIEEDISKLAPLADLEKLEEAVNPLFGYFDANGSANNALKLGGQLPSYYATVDALNLVKNDVTAVSNRVQKFEDIIDIDKNGDVYIKGTRNFYTEGGTIGMAGLGSGGSGGGTAGLGSVTVRVNGQDYITDASGIVTIPNYPSLAGYATESWVYDNYLPKSGGVITGDFGIYNPNSTQHTISISTNSGSSWIGYNGAYDYWFITDRGWSNSYALIHSGNIGSYNAGSATKLQTARSIWGQLFDGTEDIPTSLSATMSYTLFSKYDGSGYAGYVGRGASSDNSIQIETYGAEPIDFSTNSTGRMRITSDGNILVNTYDAAGARFKVNGAVRFINAYFGNATEQYTPVDLGDLGNGTIGLAGAEGYGLYAWTDYSSGNTYLQCGRRDGEKASYNLLLQTMGGKVGVGTANPTAILDVNGSAKFNSTITLSNSGYFIGGSNGFRFNDSSDTYNNFIIHNDGNTTTRGTSVIKGHIQINNTTDEQAITFFKNSEYRNQIDAASENFYIFSYRSAGYWKNDLTIHRETGNVGIGGNADNTYKLKVYGTGDFTTVRGKLESTYIYNTNTMSPDDAAQDIFTTGAESLAFTSFMSDHPLWNNWSDVWNFSGYGRWGGTQFATEYNAINPRVAIRKYNQTRSNWGDWTEFITSANIGSQSVTYATNATKLYANDYYAYGGSSPYYAQMRYNVAGDGRWYLSVYPETPKTIVVDYAYKADELTNTRYLWGKAFRGAADVYGDIKLGTDGGDYKIGSAYATNDQNMYNHIVFGSGSTGLEYHSGEWTSGNHEAHKFIVKSGHKALVIHNDGNICVGGASHSNAKVRIQKNSSHYWGWYLGGLIDGSDFAIEYANSPYVYGLYAAVNASTGQVGLQVGRSDGDTNAYDLCINPLGGNLLVGTTSSGSAKLRVQTKRADTFTWTLGSLASKSDMALEFYQDSSNIYGLYTAINYSSGGVAMQVGRSDGGTAAYNLALNPLGGDVMIGTTSNSNGYKLNIASSGERAYDFHIYNNTTKASFFVGKEAMWYGSSKTTGQMFAIMRGCSYDGGGGTVVFEVNATGDVWSEGTIAMAKLASSSDAKLKENIKWLSADRAMEVVRALNPTEWDWKKDHTHSFGFIAQDVQPIIPEMVSSVNDTLRLEYNQLHAFEIGAIQHIDSEVEILKRRVTELENELKQYRRNA